jgi:hypothetical protein
VVAYDSAQSNHIPESVRTPRWGDSTRGGRKRRSAIGKSNRTAVVKIGQATLSFHFYARAFYKRLICDNNSLVRHILRPAKVLQHHLLLMVELSLMLLHKRLRKAIDPALRRREKAFMK